MFQSNFTPSRDMLAVGLNFTLGSQKGKGTTGSLSEQTAAHCFHIDASPSLQAQTNMSPAESVQQMSLKLGLEASFHVQTQTARWLPAAPAESRLFDKVLQSRGMSADRSLTTW